MTKDILVCNSNQSNPQEYVSRKRKLQAAKGKKEKILAQVRYDFLFMSGDQSILFIFTNSKLLKFQVFEAETKIFIEKSSSQ